MVPVNARIILYSTKSIGLNKSGLFMWRSLCKSYALSSSRLDALSFSSLDRGDCILSNSGDKQDRLAYYSSILHLSLCDKNCKNLMYLKREIVFPLTPEHRFMGIEI